jgi:hypothetical protein
MTNEPTPITPCTTSGPYAYRRSSDGCDETWEVFAEGDGRVIAAIPFWDEGDGLAAAKAEAEARLFAAAPDLLEALVCLLVQTAGLDLPLFPGQTADDPDARDHAMEVLEKATGGAVGILA